MRLLPPWADQLLRQANLFHFFIILSLNLTPKLRQKRVKKRLCHAGVRKGGDAYFWLRDLGPLENCI